MRFRVIDKILLVLLLLMTVAASALLFLMAIKAVGGEGAVYYIELLTNGHIVNRLILGGAGLLLLVVALRLFIALCSRPDKATETVRQQPTSTLVLSGDNGSAYITLAAIDSLVQRNVRKNPLVRECESLVTVPGDGTTGGVKIALRLSCAPETIIPELSGELQKSLKAELEAMTGVGVTGVDVLILPPPVNKAPKTL